MRLENEKPSENVEIRSWWEWVLQIPMSENPAYGYKGSMSEIPSADKAQPYPDKVWFLAGAFNDGTLPHTRNLVHRYVMGMPADRALLMPVINFYGVIRDAKKQNHLEELERRVKEEMDVISPESLYVTIDGQEIKDLAQYRADTSVVFPITVDGKDNVVKMRHVLGRPIKLWAKGDGYWLFLKPSSLTSGNHEIHSFGSCLQGKIQIDIHYKVEVR